MLIALASVKGSPGVTSTALALAAVWPKPVVLVEADPTGGDLAYRCRLTPAAAVGSRGGLVGLAAAVRAHAGYGSDDEAGMGAALLGASVELGCGVRAVTGVTSTAQSRGMARLWPAIGDACATAGVDVIADLGRLERDNPVASLTADANHLLVLASASLESVMHLYEAMPDLMTSMIGPDDDLRCSPVLVGPDEHATRDRSDLDNLLLRHGLPIGPTLAVPVDPRALQRLEDGENPSGRLGRTLLLRATKSIAMSLADSGSLRSPQFKGSITVAPGSSYPETPQQPAAGDAASTRA